eukprot:Rmarinus@m.5405
MSLDPGWQFRFRPLWWLIPLRILNSILLQTFFMADEYWQGPEVAHHLVFGYGHLTWEWRLGLRSYLHPLVLSVPLYILQFLGIDNWWLIANSPRMFQGVFAALTDIAVYNFSGVLFGRTAARFALLSTVLCWFHAYCLPRPFSNSMEATFVTVVFAAWPWRMQDLYGTSIRTTALLCLAGLGVALRPTMAALVVALCVVHVFRLRTFAQMCLFFLSSLLAGLTCVMVILITDRIGYHNPDLTLRDFSLTTFLRWNIVEGLSSFYGTLPWHWYLLAGFPAVISTFLPFFLIGVFTEGDSMVYDAAKVAKQDGEVHHDCVVYRKENRTGLHPKVRKRPTRPFQEGCWVNEGTCVGDFAERRKGRGQKHRSIPRWVPLIPAAVLVTILSMIPHKEFRFVLPVLPTLFAYVGRGISIAARWHHTLAMWFLAFAAAANILIASYLGIFHQRGAISAVNDLSSTFYLHESSAGSIHFLMPCHLYPYYAHMHTPVELAFLDCSPRHIFHPEDAIRPMETIATPDTQSGESSGAPLYERDTPLSEVPSGLLLEATHSEVDLFYNDPGRFLGDTYDFADTRCSNDTSRVEKSSSLSGAPPLLRDCDDFGSNCTLRIPPRYAVMFEDMWVRTSSLWESHGYTQRQRFFHTVFPMDRDAAAVIVVERLCEPMLAESQSP